MKKLIFVFIALFAVVLIAGCGARQNTVRFNNEDGTSNNEEMTETSDTEETVGDSEDVDTVEEGEVVEATEGEKEGVSTMEENTPQEEVMQEESKEVAAIALPTGKLAVTSMNGAYLKTNLSYNVVKGTTPSNTSQITINGYKLQKYLAGQTQWDYIAATRFGTLKDGTNNYVLKALNSEGKELASLMFTINYDAPTVPNELPDVGSNHWLALLIALSCGASYTLLRKLRWL